MARRRRHRTTAPAVATRSWRGPAAAALVVVVLAAAAAWWLAARRAHHPNIVVITIDTLRADHLGSYGYGGGKTPALDAMAAEGARFVDVVAHVPLTLPSHASLFTGLTPPRHGVRNNPDFALPAGVPTVAERFHAAGYSTAAFVSGFPLHRRFGLAKGFEVYDDRFPRGEEWSGAPYTERRADQTVAAARAWLERRNADAPFFLWVHLFDPHRPYDPPEPFRTEFRAAPYDGEIAFVDTQIAELRRLIAAAGGQTIVFVTADHGEGLNEHGEPTHGLFVYDSTIRVPLIVAGDGVPPGRVIAAPAALVDIAPTLLDLATLAPLAISDGRSLAPALRGSRQAPPSEGGYVESEYGRLCCGWAPLHAWRDGRWMFIDAPEPELYDLIDDPHQLHNVAATDGAALPRLQRAARAAATQAPVGGGAGGAHAASKELAALGYFSGGANVPASLADPKRMAATALAMEDAIAREREDPAAAARALEPIVDADPRNALARRHLALSLAAMHDYRRAVEQAKQLQAMGDDSPETMVLLGDSERLAGDAAAAIRTLDAAAKRENASTDVVNALGRALLAAGDRPAAATAFRRSLAMIPDDPEALESLADMTIEQGDLDQARTLLERLYSLDRDDARVGVKLSAVLARSGRGEDAIRMLSAIADRSPGNVDAQVNLAAALAKIGAPARAVVYFEKAIAAGARAPVVWNGLAMARLQSGNAAGAIDALRRSLAAKPDQPDIRDLLQRVEHR